MLPRQSVYLTLEVAHGEIWQIAGVHSTLGAAEAQRTEYKVEHHDDGWALSIQEWEIDGDRNLDVV